MLGLLLKPEIKELIASRDLVTLRDFLMDWPPADLAELLADLQEQEQAIVFRILPKALAADTFEYLPIEDQKALLKALAHEDVAAILNEMAPDDRTALLEELPSTTVNQLLALLSPEERRIATTLLGYPEQSIGRLMTPDYVPILEGWTVEEALDHIRKNGRDSETMHMLYVVDNKGKLIDDVRLRHLILAAPHSRISDLMDHKFVALQANEDQEVAVAAFKKYSLPALPVVDSERNLLGIVTIDDVMHVQEEENTEDIQKFGGMETFEEPYMEIGLLPMVKKRSTWLVLLFLGEMLTATAMAFFEKEIQRAVVLALFVPLIISSGGNSGSQAATLIIRAMALGEVGLRDWFRVMRREILSGFLLGCVLACIGFLRITVWSQFTDLYGAHWLLVACTVAGALVGVVMWGTIAGSMLPFILRRFGADPATSSAPFVATLVDVSGLVIYFSVAAAILRGTML